MVDSEYPTGHALELAGSATLATARPRIAFAAVAKPAAEVAGLLLVEVLGNPRARAAALGLARSLARWFASRRPPAWAGVEMTTWQVTVVQDADTSVLVHRVETALVVRTLGGPAVGPTDDWQPRAARTTAVSERPARQRRPAGAGQQRPSRKLSDGRGLERPGREPQGR